MFPRLLAGLALAAALAAPLPALAQRFVSLSFSQLGLGIATRVTDLGADATNRIWVATNQGVSAAAGDQRAQFFPFRANDGLLDNEVRAVTFGRVGTDENFFLGFPSGIQWGRILSTSGLSLGTPDLVIPPSTDARNAVNELASDGAATVWSATAGGLLAWDIGGQAPGTNPDTFLAAAAPITHVVASPRAWGTDLAAVASSSRDLYLVRAGGSANPAAFFTTTGATNTVVDLAFDGAGNLWLLTSGRDVVRFNVVFDPAPPNQGSFPTSSAFRFDNAQRTATALAVDPLTDTVWLGTDDGAYFQDPVAGSLASRLCGTGDTPGVGCWARDATPGFTAGRRVDEILADASGNTWFGTDDGLRGLIVRLLSLNASLYLGAGASASVTLEDLPTFARNGNDSATNPSPDTATIKVAVGGATQDLTAVEQPGDTGRFVFTFALAEIGTVPTAEGTDVTVQYAFEDANQVERTLTALARWANIVDFEDDAWIGGPCFLEALER